MKLNTTIKTLCAAVAFAASAAANAGLVWMDIGTDYGNNATPPGFSDFVNNTSTGIKSELNLDYTSTTVLNLSDGTFSTTFGWNESTLLSITGNGGVGGNNVGSFDPGSATNGYGLDNSWFMTFSGSAFGTFSIDQSGKVILSYNSGTVKLFASESPYDVTKYSQFMTIGITGGDTIPGNTDIIGKVTDISGKYADLFNSVYVPSCSANSSSSFDDILACGDQAPIWFSVNLNTYDPTFVLSADKKTMTASGSHNGSAQFDVPEPASLALLGMGLFGLGAIRRRKTV